MDAAALLEFDAISAAAGAALWPGSVIISGIPYAAAIIPPKLILDLGPYAETPGDAVLTVRVSKALLPAAPRPNTYLTYASESWKIRSATGPAHESQWTLSCARAV